MYPSRLISMLCCLVLYADCIIVSRILMLTSTETVHHQTIDTSIYHSISIFLSLTKRFSTILTFFLQCYALINIKLAQIMLNSSFHQTSRFCMGFWKIQSIVFQVIYRKLISFHTTTALKIITWSSNTFSYQRHSTIQLTQVHISICSEKMCFCQCLGLVNLGAPRDLFGSRYGQISLGYQIIKIIVYLLVNVIVGCQITIIIHILCIPTVGNIKHISSVISHIEMSRRELHRCRSTKYITHFLVAGRNYLFHLVGAFEYIFYCIGRFRRFLQESRIITTTCHNSR